MASLILWSAVGCAQQQASVEMQVVDVLNRQVQAWNEGDVDAFVDHYWHSPDLSFTSGGHTERGWQATLNRYRRRYPTRKAMGKLAFSGLDVRPLAAGSALVLGHWHLDRETGPIGGCFTLVFENKRGKWVITHDHTSVESATE